LGDREKASWDCWEVYKKISYQQEIEGYNIDTIIWGKDQFMSQEEWKLALRKY
jgi:hypothetical protein